MPNKHLTVEDVVSIHDEQIAAYGGAKGVRDMALIESAVFRVQSGYEPDIFSEAASLWEGLTMNHGFVDGNKRVGLACADIYLLLYGNELDVSEDELLNFINDLLENHAFKKPVLGDFLRSRCVKSD